MIRVTTASRSQTHLGFVNKALRIAEGTERVITNAVTGICTLCIVIFVAHSVIAMEAGRTAKLDGLKKPCLGKVLRNLGPAI